MKILSTQQKNLVLANLEILKQKGAYPYELQVVLKDLMKTNQLLENISSVQQKKGKIDNDGKISDGHVTIKDYMTYEKMWIMFNNKNMGDYHDNYF